MNVPKQFLLVKKLIGCRVHNQEGEELGTVENLLVEVETGQVQYVVLSVGGYFGLGNKSFLFSWGAVNYIPEENALTLNFPVNKGLLESVPSVDPSHSPYRWDSINAVDDYYKTATKQIG